MREPLVLRGLLVGIPTAILHALVVLGLFDLSGDAEKAIAAVVDAVGAVLIILLSRPKVTPVDDPQNAQGSQLVPKT